MDRVQCSRDLELAHQLQEEEDRRRKSEESRQEIEEFQKLQVHRFIRIIIFWLDRVVNFETHCQHFRLLFLFLLLYKIFLNRYFIVHISHHL